MYDHIILNYFMSRFFILNEISFEHMILEINIKNHVTFWLFKIVSNNFLLDYSFIKKLHDKLNSAIMQNENLLVFFKIYLKLLKIKLMLN